MQLSNHYLTLDPELYKADLPDKVAAPQLILWNQALANSLGIIQTPDSDEKLLAEWFSGSQLMPGSQPIALAYAGHQYAQLVPQLGDGRAHLLGELEDCYGNMIELQLKGSGATPFSRGGDGKCGLGPAIREYIMSEAMHELGVPSMRSLAVTTTGEPVYRQEPQAGAVVCRTSNSHVRVGTFQFFAMRNKPAIIDQLVELSIERNFAHLSDLQGADKVTAFFEAVMTKTAELMCHWMRVGFIHGVMNTDNAAINGHTIDFGPCAMLGQYDPKAVYSSIDRRGRYAFANQSSISQWNLARLAECLLPLIDADSEVAVAKATDMIEDYPRIFKQKYQLMMANKIGFDKASEQSNSLILSLLSLMEEYKLDYTNTFNYLRQSLSGLLISEAIEVDDYKALDLWERQWQLVLKSGNKQNKSQAIELMANNNPLVIPRNYLVENAIAEANEKGELKATHSLIEIMKNPYKMMARDQQFFRNYHEFDQEYKTFCGT
jgi:serine/tyrosine/threonine adenylyltransferase